MAFFSPVYGVVVDVLVLLASLAYLATAKSNEKRLEFLAGLAGFYALIYLFGVDFIALQFFLMAWLIFVGANLIISREMALLMLLAALLLPAVNPLFFFLRLCIPRDYSWRIYPWRSQKTRKNNPLILHNYLVGACPF